jgi:hypothetical protein
LAFLFFFALIQHHNKQLFVASLFTHLLILSCKRQVSFEEPVLAFQFLYRPQYNIINASWSNPCHETTTLANFIITTRPKLPTSALFEAADELWPP